MLCASFQSSWPSRSQLKRFMSVGEEVFSETLFDILVEWHKVFNIF